MKTVSFLLIFGSVACVPLHAQTAPGNIHAAQLPPAVADWQKEEPVRAPHAMVVSIHHLAADAGISILKLGAMLSTQPWPLASRWPWSTPMPVTSVAADSCSST